MHTPGEWEIKEWPPSLLAIRTVENNEEIAILILDGDLPEGEVRANVRLLVQAPALLEALQDIVNVAQLDTFERYMFVLPEEVVENARAAIAAAQGEEAQDGKSG